MKAHRRFVERLGVSWKPWIRVFVFVALVFFFARPRFVHAQDKSVDASGRSVLFRDDTPRDLGVVTPGKILRVRIPIINTLNEELMLTESSSSCLCTSVVPLNKLFSPNSENQVELVIAAGKEEGIKQVTAELSFRGSAKGSEAIVTIAHIAMQLRVVNECSFSSNQVLFNTKHEHIDLFATNYGRFMWNSIQCSTGNKNVITKCYVKDGVDVNGEQRQVARVRFELTGIPSGEGFNEKIDLHVFAQPLNKAAVLVEVGTCTVDVIRPKRIEVTPRVLYLNNVDDLTFFVLSNDDSFAIADKDLELFVQPNNVRINANIKKISPRWVRVVVKASEFSGLVGNAEALQLHVHSRDEKVGLASAELVVR